LPSSSADTSMKASTDAASVSPGTEAVLGLQKSEVDTPSLLVDLDKFERNVGTMSDCCRNHGINWRPHSKAHKSPDIAHLLVEAGAIGITCAKLAEAEVMLANGIDNVLIANTIVTPQKLRRLAELQRLGRVLMAVDNEDVVQLAGQMASAVSTTIPVLIDIDIGMNRTGVEPGEAALQLARTAAGTPGVDVRGIMGYEGHVLSVDPAEEKIRACHQALSHLVEAKGLFEKDGIPVETVSAGGTGCYQITAAYNGITEIQAGGGIFMDNMYRKDCFVDDLDLALTVLATVTSRHSGHIVTDAGFKTMSSSHAEPTPVDRDDIVLRYLSAEHGVWDLKPGCAGPRIGEQVEFVVGYSDSTNFLHDRFLAMRDGRVEAVWKLMARGKLT
jgi:D-serine deaminase-like pyridoxal phosphate-dependent protein